MNPVILTIFAVFMIFSPAASAQQYYYVQPSPFWNSYNAARGNGDITAVLSAQRNSEAMVNAYREAHGLPKCSIGLLGQWAGRPAC
jgi:hypothetical protein